MKKLVCLVLPFVLVSSSVLPCRAQSSPEVPAPAAASPSPAVFTEKGRAAAGQLPTTGAFTIGFVSGLGLGLIGTGLAWAFQGEPQPPASTVQSLPDAESRLAYTDAYAKQGKKKKRGAALTGGLLGTAVIVAVVASSGSSSE